MDLLKICFGKNTLMFTLTAIEESTVNFTTNIELCDCTYSQNSVRISNYVNYKIRFSNE